MGEPVHRLLHWRSLEPAGHVAARLRAGDQAGIAQNVEVLHDRRQRHREGPRQLADGEAVLGVEAGEQRPPRGIGEGGEGAIERGNLTVNHIVNN